METFEINWLLRQLTYLQQILKRQLGARGGWFHSSTTGVLNNSIGGDHKQVQNENSEKVLLQNLAEDFYEFLSIVIEVLGFWKILSEHVVHKIIKLVVLFIFIY